LYFLKKKIGLVPSKIGSQFQKKKFKKKKFNYTNNYKKTLLEFNSIRLGLKLRMNWICFLFCLSLESFVWWRQWQGTLLELWKIQSKFFIWSICAKDFFHDFLFDFHSDW